MRSRGFTLVELLVAMSVTSILLVFIFYLFFAGIRVYEKISQNIKQVKVMVFVMDKMTDDVLMSKGIDPISNQQELSLLHDESNILYNYKNNKVRRQKGSKASYLTIENDIKGLEFEYLDSGVKVKLNTAIYGHMFSVYPRNL